MGTAGPAQWHTSNSQSCSVLNESEEPYWNILTWQWHIPKTWIHTVIEIYHYSFVAWMQTTKQKCAGLNCPCMSRKEGRKEKWHETNFVSLYLLLILKSYQVKLYCRTQVKCPYHCGRSCNRIEQIICKVSAIVLVLDISHPVQSSWQCTNQSSDQYRKYWSVTHELTGIFQEVAQPP